MNRHRRAELRALAEAVDFAVAALEASGFAIAWPEPDPLTGLPLLAWGRAEAALERAQEEAGDQGV